MSRHACRMLWKEIGKEKSRQETQNKQKQGGKTRTLCRKFAGTKTKKKTLVRKKERKKGLYKGYHGVHTKMKRKKVWSHEYWISSTHQVKIMKTQMVHRKAMDEGGGVKKKIKRKKCKKGEKLNIKIVINERNEK